MKPSAGAEFARGFGHLLRGFRYMATHPSRALLGLVPPLVMGVVALGAVVTLAIFAPDLAAVLTPFANSWTDQTARDGFRFALAAALIAGFAVTVLLVFATLTLAAGFPIYDKISASVDATLPPVRKDERGERRNLIADVAIAVLKGACVGIGAFLLGLIPVVGQVGGLVFGALVGGPLLAVELLESPMSRRGLVRRDSRVPFTRHRRALCTGFAGPVYLAMILPVLSILIFPIASAGAVYLARDLRGEPIDQR